MMLPIPPAAPAKPVSGSLSLYVGATDELHYKQSQSRLDQMPLGEMWDEEFPKN